MAASNVEARKGVILLGRDEAKLEADQVLELRSLVAQDGHDLEIVLTSERRVIEEHLERIVIAAGPMPRAVHGNLLPMISESPCCPGRGFSGSKPCLP